MFAWLYVLILRCCWRPWAAELCAYMVAVALAVLGDDTELADRLAGLSQGEVVALALELADRSAWARQAIWLSLDARGSR